MLSAMTRRQLLSTIGGLAAGSLTAAGCFRRADFSPAIEPIDLGLQGAARAIRAGSVSPLDLTERCLDRIARFNGPINAFITVTREEALADARRAASEIASGRWRGPLHGIPVGIKDNLDTKGVRTTAASAVFADRVPTEDADVVHRLKQAGAVLVGKLNMHEVEQGTTSVISAAGPVRNPWDISRIAGGSSGGSGAAVAASNWRRPYGGHDLR
jgi:aspartyl-tRNA(Asn)/glutamyl-tRNA(Gln) amidotransferase subunit A